MKYCEIIADNISKAGSHSEFGRQIHEDLRIHHPEWAQANGESPICDSNEARLMELLGDLEEVWEHSPPVVPTHEREQPLQAQSRGRASLEPKRSCGANSARRCACALALFRLAVNGARC